MGIKLILFHCVLHVTSHILLSYCDQEVSTTQLLFEEDRNARQTFDPTNVSYGLFNYQPDNPNRSASHSVRKIDQLLMGIPESTGLRLMPASTAWRFFRTFLRGHVDQLLINATSLEFSYIYTNSTGLMPTATTLFRRGNPQIDFMPRDYINNNDQWEFPIRLVMQKTGNGTFGFPSPGQDISYAFLLGTTRYGRTTGDCSADASSQQVNIAQFTQAMKEDCIGVAAPISDDYTCWKNVQQCRRPDCTKNCCSQQDGHYNPNATCAYLQNNPRMLNGTVTFMDLLKHLSYWSLDAPKGTGRPLQKALILTKNVRTQNAPNAEVTDEVTNQLQRTSSAMETLLSRMIVNAENSLPAAPTAIDLALVCAAVLSALLAIDSLTIFKKILKILRMLEKKQSSRAPILISVFLAVIVASSPSFITAGVIVYQELARGMLNMVRAGNGWHAKVVWDSPGGEKIWWIRHVLLDMKVTTAHGVRPLYIVLPICVTILDVWMELYRLMRSRCTSLESDHGCPMPVYHS